MDEILKDFMEPLAWPWLLLVIAASIALLGKAADWLVDETVALSEISGLPKAVIGATVVSLGTTTPEAAVSVFAALQGDPELALGNAVGSIICDTGLILGMACLIAPLPIPRHIVNRQGWLQLLAGFLLVGASWSWTSPLGIFETGGRLSQFAGFAFLILLGLYLWQSVRWAKQGTVPVDLEEFEEDVQDPIPWILVKLVVAIALVVVASKVLIPAVNVAAVRMAVPKSVIAATLVAFGTSLPELVTAVAATRRGHGDLAIGNVVGADVLNVLFVAGAAAAATPGGLDVSSHFFRILFPSMLFILIVFRLGLIFSKTHFQRPFGVVLLTAYLLTMVLSYLVPGAQKVL